MWFTVGYLERLNSPGGHSKILLSSSPLDDDHSSSSVVRIAIEFAWLLECADSDEVLWLAAWNNICHHPIGS